MDQNLWFIAYSSSYTNYFGVHEGHRLLTPSAGGTCSLLCDRVVGRRQFWDCHQMGSGSLIPVRLEGSICSICLLAKKKSLGFFCRLNLHFAGLNHHFGAVNNNFFCEINPKKSKILLFSIRTFFLQVFVWQTQFFAHWIHDFCWFNLIIVKFIDEHSISIFSPIGLGATPLKNMLVKSHFLMPKPNTVAEFVFICFHLFSFVFPNFSIYLLCFFISFHHFSSSIFSFQAVQSRSRRLPGPTCTASWHRQVEATKRVVPSGKLT